jgi:hypothetical protein
MLVVTSYVFVPSVFVKNIPTAEFGMISAETACWDKKIAKFLMRIFSCRSTFLYGLIHGRMNYKDTEPYMPAFL